MAHQARSSWKGLMVRFIIMKISFMRYWNDFQLLDLHLIPKNTRLAF